MKKITYTTDNGDAVWTYISYPITRILIRPILKTPITGNQVTGLSIVFALIAAVMFSSSSYVYGIVAGLILQAVLVMDCMDGIIARYKGQTSFYGKYLDALFHEIVPTSIFFALGIHSYRYFGSVIPIYLGGITGILIYFINVSRSNKERLVLYHIQKTGNVVGYNLHKLSKAKDQSLIMRVASVIIHIFNSPGYFFTILLILAIADLLQYAIFFYSLFFFSIAVVKGSIELTQGFKPYGLR